MAWLRRLWPLVVGFWSVAPPAQMPPPVLVVVGWLWSFRLLLPVSLVCPAVLPSPPVLLGLFVRWRLGLVRAWCRFLARLARPAVVSAVLGLPVALALGRRWLWPWAWACLCSFSCPRGLRRPRPGVPGRWLALALWLGPGRSLARLVLLVRFSRRSLMSYVYLLHFDRPVSNRHTCQHYLGFAEDLAIRLQRHKSGNGARLVEVALSRGIGFELVRVWRGDRHFERQLKNQKGGTRLCPICNPGNRRVKKNELSKQEIKHALIPF